MSDAHFTQEFIDQTIGKIEYRLRPKSRVTKVTLSRPEAAALNQEIYSLRAALAAEQEAHEVTRRERDECRKSWNIILTMLAELRARLESNDNI